MPSRERQTRDTFGHCCWPGQSWSRDRLECVGEPNCPENYALSDGGLDCERARCAGGRVLASGRCCWPGQTWSATSNRCQGMPECPSDYMRVKAECMPRKAGYVGERLSYRPPKQSDFERVERGAYARGSERREPGRYNNEGIHTVGLTRDIFVKKTEVTQREWLGLVELNPSLFSACGLDCPVERVSWYETLAWLNRLSKAEGLQSCYTLSGCQGQLGSGCTGAARHARTCTGDFVCQDVGFVGLDCTGYRLPTEAEWEYVARAGTTTSTYAGNLTIAPARDAFILDPIAWYRRNSQVDHGSGQACSSQLNVASSGPKCGTQPVGQKAPTDWGHYDLLGNVMEWVWDGFSRYPTRSAVNPVAHLGLERVVRGGSWASEGRFLRSALRSRLGPAGRNAEIGFRFVRTAPQTPSVVQHQPPTNEGDAPIDETQTSNPEHHLDVISPPPGKPLHVEHGLIPTDAEPKSRPKGNALPKDKKSKRKRGAREGVKLKIVTDSAD